MPRVEVLIDDNGRAKFITTLDLAQGYWQKPVAEEAKHLSAFITHFGLYQFRVMPFGLKGAPAMFQRSMDVVLRGLQGFSVAYTEDVAVFSNSWEEHLQHMRIVRQLIREADLTAKPQKCPVWYVSVLVFGSHHWQWSSAPSNE